MRAPSQALRTHQAERVEVLQEHGQRGGSDHAARPRVVLEGEHTLLAVESAMPDEVEDVDVVVTQGIAQAGEPRIVEKADPDLSLIDRPGQRLLQPLLFLGNVEHRDVGRVRHHNQYVQGGCDREGLDRVRKIDETHQRRVGQQAQETAQRIRVEVFPGDRRELGHRRETQADPETLAFVLRFVEAHLEGGPDVTGKYGVVELRPEPQGGIPLGGTNPSDPPPRLSHVQDEVFKFEIGEWLGELTPGLAGG